MESASEQDRRSTISKRIVKYACPFLLGCIKSTPGWASFHSFPFIKNIWYKMSILIEIASRMEGFLSCISLRAWSPHYNNRTWLPLSWGLTAKPPTGLQWRCEWYYHCEEDKMYYYHYFIFNRVWLWQEEAGCGICRKHFKKINWVKFLRHRLSNLSLSLLSSLNSQLWRGEKKIVQSRPDLFTEHLLCTWCCARVFTPKYDYVV